MKNRKRFYSFLLTMAYILAILVCVVNYTIQYLSENVQVASFSQLLYTMQVSMGGAENVIWQVIGGFLESYSIRLLFLTAFWMFASRALKWGFALTEHKKNAARIHGLLNTGAIVISACLCLAVTSVLGDSIRTGYDVMGIEEYLEARSHHSTLYENDYVKPSQTDISFPENKKNLIYIFCESMESTYANVVDEEKGNVNLIPNLTRIAKENTDFSDASFLNGPRVTNSTSWTIAGMVAQTSGTPLALSNGEFTRDFADDAPFMPKVTSIGDILEEEGYTNYLMVGSEAAYGGRANYFSQHGNYEIFDLDTAKKEGKIPAGYKEWWGFEDDKLFEYAKEKITDLSEGDQPFNFTMLTADTHFKDGYECPDCPDLYEEQMENVIACSDHKISEFIDWIQDQPFYEDTVIVISGDHLNMDGLIPQILHEDQIRRTYFSIINSDLPDPGYREFTTLDLFPTTLAALGAQIEGNRLGLGVNLYSDIPTIAERDGFNEFNEQISYRSRYYDEEILDTTQYEDGFEG